MKWNVRKAKNRVKKPRKIIYFEPTNDDCIEMNKKKKKHWREETLFETKRGEWRDDDFSCNFLNEIVFELWIVNCEFEIGEELTCILDGIGGKRCVSLFYGYCHTMKHREDYLLIATCFCFTRTSNKKHQNRTYLLLCFGHDTCFSIYSSFVPSFSSWSSFSYTNLHSLSLTIKR